MRRISRSPAIPGCITGCSLANPPPPPIPRRAPPPAAPVAEHRRASRARKPAMKAIVPEKIEDYCRRHTSARDPLLRELEKYTQRHHPAARMLIGPYEGALL